MICPLIFPTLRPLEFSVTVAIPFLNIAALVSAAGTLGLAVIGTPQHPGTDARCHRLAASVGLFFR